MLPLPPPDYDDGHIDIEPVDYIEDDLAIFDYLERLYDEEFEYFLDSLKYNSFGFTETRRVYCFECDTDFEDAIEIGGELQYLSTEYCRHGCTGQELEIYDDMDRRFETSTQDFEEEH